MANSTEFLLFCCVRFGVGTQGNTLISHEMSGRALPAAICSTMQVVCMHYIHYRSTVRLEGSGPGEVTAA